MNPEDFDRVDRYLCEALVSEDDVLIASREAAHAAGLPDHQVAANQGALLLLLARAVGAKRILEVGTLGGYSTIWLARALGPDGQLDTLELDATHAACARENFARSEVADRIEVHEGAARETLARFIDEGRAPYDFVFIDADKPNNPHYLEAALALTRKGSMILVDNVVREGKVASDASEDPRVRGVRAMLARIREEPRLRATALQTVGSKGWDGFALLYVTSD